MPPRRSALLVATYDYQDDDLRRLTAPKYDVEALAKVLRNSEIANFDVEVLVNKPHDVVGRVIGKFYQNRRSDDLTLLYFSGHGLKDDQGCLYLAMTNTVRDNLLFTGISTDQIDQAMGSCRSRYKILILDCCYSGAFPAGRISKTGDQVHTLERFQGRGRVVLTASDATQYSFEGNDISGKGINSVFTRFLVEGLTTGEADRDSDGDISIDELYSYVHDRVIEEMPQQRPKKLENVEGPIVIARNIHWSLPPHIRAAIQSPFSGDRLAVLESLARLHRMGNSHVRAEVINQLQRLTHDDSNMVCNNAAKFIVELNARKDQPKEQPESSLEEEPRIAKGVSPRKVLITLSALLALAMTIMIIVVMSVSTDSSPSGPTTAPEPVPSATAGPEVSMPSIGSPITVGKAPNFVVVSPDGRHAYVANGITNGDTPFITVVNTATNQVIATVPITAGPPQFLAFAPDGRRMYVAIYNDQRTIHEVDVFDTGSNTVVARIPQPARPFLPAVSPNGKLLFVPNHDIASLSIIATDTNTVTAQINVPENPHWVAFSSDGKRAYTANHESNLVAVIDAVNLKIISTIPVGTSPHSIAVSPNRPLVANVNYDGSSVTEIDTNTLKVVATIPVGKNPQDIIWAPDGRFAYVVDEGSDTVSVIDAATNQVTANIPTGESPTSIAVLPDGRQAYVSNSAGGTLTVLRLTG